MNDAEKIELLREALKAAFEDACKWFDDSMGGAPEDLKCFEIVNNALEQTE